MAELTAYQMLREQLMKYESINTESKQIIEKALEDSSVKLTEISALEKAFTRLKSAMTTLKTDGIVASLDEFKLIKNSMAVTKTAIDNLTQEIKNIEKTISFHQVVNRR